MRGGIIRLCIGARSKGQTRWNAETIIEYSITGTRAWVRESLCWEILPVDTRCDVM